MQEWGVSQHSSICVEAGESSFPFSYLYQKSEPQCTRTILSFDHQKIGTARRLSRQSDNTKPIETVLKYEAIDADTVQVLPINSHGQDPSANELNFHRQWTQASCSNLLAFQGEDRLKTETPAITRSKQ